MADVALHRLAHDFVVSLRRTVDVPHEAISRQAVRDAADYKELLLDVEKARLALAPLMRSAERTQPNQIRFLKAFVNELLAIIDNEKSVRILHTIRFRPIESPGNRASLKDAIPRLDGRPPSDDAIKLFITFILDGIGEVTPDRSTKANIAQLKAIVPRQKIAPVQFDISGNKLVIVRDAHVPRVEDQRNVEVALTELQQNGHRIIQELESSNCDRRLLESVQRLHTYLSEDVNAIKVGFANLGCEAMCNQFENELPSAVLSMLRAHTRGVQMFVGQFPEWSRFIENAASAELDVEDVKSLGVASNSLTRELANHVDVVDQEVPRTLSFLVQLLQSPAKSSKRAAFALIRSIENMVSLIFKHCADFADKTVTKTIDSASTATSKILVGIALAGALSISSVASKIPDMGWLKTAIEIVEKEIIKAGK